MGMKKIILFIIRFRFLFLIILLFGLIWACMQLPKLSIDNSLKIWFIKNDPTVVNYENFKKMFGNDEVIVIAFSDEKSILSDENKKLIRNITEDIKEINYIKDVYSLANTLNSNHFLSEDNRTTIIYIELEAVDNIDKFRSEINSRVKNYFENRFKGTGKKYFIAGGGILHDELNKISLQDSNLLITLSYVLIFIVLAIFIKRIKYILISAFIILYTVIFSLGIFSFFGKSINMVTMVLPTLLMIFCVADIIHITNYYFRFTQENPRKKKIDLIVKSVSFIAFPCFLTSATTAIGFISLVSSKMQVIQDLGIFVALGVMLEFVFSIIIISIGFSFLSIISFKKERKSHFFKNIYDFIFNRKKIILIVSLFIFIFSVIMVFYIKVDTYSIQFLRKDHFVRQDSDYIEKHFGFYTPIEFIFKIEKNDFLNTYYLEQVKSFIKIINNELLVENAISLLDFIPAIEMIKDQTQLENILNMIPETQKRRFINKDRNVMRISARIKMLSASGFKNVIESILDKKSVALDKRIKVEPAGYLPLYIKIMEYITFTQITSFSMAFIIIFLIVGFYASSFRLAIFAILTNLFPLGVTLGMMGILGIRLDIATVTISAIAIGVVVDDTIHFLYKFKYEKFKEKKELKNAIIATIKETGQSIISTSVILILGFTVLTFSQVKSIQYFGILSCIVIFSALLADLFILPLLLLLFYNKKKV